MRRRYEVTAALQHVANTPSYGPISDPLVSTASMIAFQSSGSDRSGNRSLQQSFYRDIIPKLTDRALQQASKLGGPLSIPGMEEGFASVSLTPQDETCPAASSSSGERISQDERSTPRE